MRRTAFTVLRVLALLLVLPVAARAESASASTFDELGRLTSVTTQAGTTTYRYFEGVRAPIVAQVTNPDGSTETFDLEVAEAAYAALTSPAATRASPATPFASSLCGGTSSNRFAFNGYRYDCETGLYLTPSGRMYDPAFGRFIQQDGYLGDLARPASLHRYTFGYNNPTRYTDPTGHDPTLKADFQIDQCARNTAACQRNTVGTPEGNLVRLQGAARAVGGGFLAAAGAASAPESGGVSLVAVGVGFDQLATGLHEVITGQPQTSMVANAIEGNARVRGLSPADAKRSGAAGEALVLLGTGVATELAVPAAPAKPGIIPVRQALAEGGGGAFTVMEDGVLPLRPTGDVILRSPTEIRFSQNSIKAGFKDPKFGSIDDLAEGLRTGSVKPTEVEPIRLVEREGVYITIDNRRLEAFRRADVEIPTRMATPSEIAQATKQGKFSAGPLGSETITVRGQ